MDGNFIYNLISAIVFLAGAAGIVVKFTNKFKEMEMKVAMLEKNDDKQDQRWEELDAKISNINNTVIRISTILEKKE